MNLRARMAMLGLLRGGGAFADELEGDGFEGRFASGNPPQIELPAGVDVTRDVAYGEAEAQRLDVYAPQGASGAPVIVFVHGGGWRRGDKAMPQMVRHKVPHWTRKGFVVVSANYRMLPEADVLAQADDLARALAFVQREAGRWGGDARRVAIVGHSAGAHLAALVSADPLIASREGAAPWAATVAIDSAALDIEAIMLRPHFRFYDPVFGTEPGFWRAASPTHRLEGAPAVPMLLVCSTLRLDSGPPAQDFADKAAAARGRVELLPVALGHMELNDQLGLPGSYTDAVDEFLASAGIA